MELDQLKEAWGNAGGAPANSDIDNIIGRKNNGPLSALEKNYRYAIYIFPFVMVLFAGQFFSKSAAQHSPTSWLLFGILFIEFLVALVNLVTVKKIQNATGNLRDNLLGQLAILRSRYHNYLYIHQALYAVMAVLLEVSMHEHWDTNFEGWYNVNIFLRMLVYGVFLTLQFIIRRSSEKRQYGRHLERLNELVRDLQ